MSARAAATISARLSATSFQASRAGSVTVTYRFSRRSRTFGYLLALKKGSRWQTVNRVNRTGTFKGAHRVTVKTFFGRKPVKVGRYRLKLSADGGSKLLSFAVTRAPVTVTPKPGYWAITSLGGSVSGEGATVTGANFSVGADQTVSRLGFGYRYSTLCSATGYSAMTGSNSSPISHGQFSSPNPTGPWSGAASGFLTGTFDSSTGAHGTGTMTVVTNCLGFPRALRVGTFTWKASWRASG